MKTAIVCQDVYAYNMQAATSPLKSGTEIRDKIRDRNPGQARK